MVSSHTGQTETGRYRAATELDDDAVDHARRARMLALGALLALRGQHVSAPALVRPPGSAKRRKGRGRRAAPRSEEKEQREGRSSLAEECGEGGEGEEVELRLRARREGEEGE
eukprot:2354878-Rhodomonas_salina.1